MSAPTTYSRTSLAVIAAGACAMSALGLVLTDERPAGIGALEPGGLVAAAVVFAVGAVATVAGALRAAAWSGRIAVVLVAALAFLTFTEPGFSSVVFTEVSAVFCGVLFVTSTSRAPGRSG